MKEILLENARRNAALAVEPDPIAGDPADPSRAPFTFNGKTYWLPAEMLDDPKLRLVATDHDFARLRFRYDFPFWAATCVVITDKITSRDIPFRLNRPQRRLTAILEAERRAGRPLRLIMLKARQWGGSTLIQIYFAWIQIIHCRGWNSLICAHVKDTSATIRGMYSKLLSRYPEEYWEEDQKPEFRPFERMTNTRVIPGRECRVTVCSSENQEATRGQDYALAHLSEVAFWKDSPLHNPADLLRSVASGIASKPLSFIAMESTANGTGNFFHREYDAAKRGLSQFESMFVAWYEIDQYSAPLADAVEFAARLYAGRECDAAESDRAQPGRYLWWLWERGATLEAINWYISERSKYSDHGLMAAEYPSDDVEAFVHSGARVFDRYRVEELRAGCVAAKRSGEIDVPGAADAAGRVVSDRERAEMLRDVRFTPLPSGGWQIWKLPESEHDFEIENRYVAVVDVGGRGARADWSVIVIFDREPMLRGEGPEVVAQWRGHTDFDILAWRAAMAAQFYGHALLVIESNTLETRDPDRDVDGDQSGFILNRLREVYPNLYARRRSEEAVLMGAPVRYGFHTNISTKPAIVATLVKVIREGLYTERDQNCLDEYLSYERRQNGSYGAIAGCHDDLLMTRAIGLHICFHEMDPPRRAPRTASDYHAYTRRRLPDVLW